MTDNGTTAETVRRLVDHVVENNLAEISIEQGEHCITIKGMAATSDTEQYVIREHAAPIAAKAVSASAIPTTVNRAAPVSRIAIESPMVGVFYSSPSPDDPSYVNVGDIVKVGQTIGLIEAMKVYSEVPSEVSGRIVQVLVENGALVQMGQPMFYLEQA